jgi:hypothetical protein
MTLRYKLWEDIWSKVFLIDLDNKKKGIIPTFNLEDLKRMPDIETEVDVLYISHGSLPTPCKNTSFQSVTNQHIASKFNGQLIQSILQIGRGKISLYGGSVLSAIGDIQLKVFYSAHSSYSFFFHCTQEEAEDILTECMCFLQNIYCSSGVMSRCKENTFCVESRSGRSSNFIIRFVKRLYNTKEDVLSGFDIPGCQYGFNLDDGLFMTLGGLIALKTGSFPLDLTQRTTSYEARLCKYANKFRILMPGKIPGSTLKWKFLASKSTNDYEGDTDIETLSSNPRAFMLQSIYYDKNVLGGTIAAMGGFLMPDECCIDSSDKLFMGIERAKKYIKVYNDREKAESIWNEAQAEWVQKIRELTIKKKWEVAGPVTLRYGKFNSLPPNHEEWYRDRKISGKSVSIGISNERFLALMQGRKEIGYMNLVPQELWKVICDHWFKEEVMEAQSYLNKLIG